MCYDSKQTKSAVELKNRFKRDFPEEANLITGDLINGFEHPKTPVILNQTENIQLIEWGLIPHWVKNLDHANRLHNGTLNAKIETLSELPSYKTIIGNRCLIIADGFYEFQWEDPDAKTSKKHRYQLTYPENEIFVFGGLYDIWKDPVTGQLRTTYTIITTEPNELMLKIHNHGERMPLVLTTNEECAYLEGEDVQAFKDRSHIKLKAQLNELPKTQKKDKSGGTLSLFD